MNLTRRGLLFVIPWIAGCGAASTASSGDNGSVSHNGARCVWMNESNSPKAYVCFSKQLSLHPASIAIGTDDVAAAVKEGLKFRATVKQSDSRQDVDIKWIQTTPGTSPYLLVNGVKHAIPDGTTLLVTLRDGISHVQRSQATNKSLSDVFKLLDSDKQLQVVLGLNVE